MKSIERWFTSGYVPNGPFRDQPARFRFYVNLLEYTRRIKHLVTIYKFELIFATVATVILLLVA